MADCIFCKIVAGQMGSKLLESEHCVAFRDINAQAPTHALVVPKKHIEKLSDLQGGDYDLMGKCIELANEVAKHHKLEGYRLVVNCGAIAQQTVWHIHFHVLGGRPMRWPPG